MLISLTNRQAAFAVKRKAALGGYRMQKLACMALSVMLLMGSAVADDYPSGPVTVVVPLAPGGVADLVGRTLISCRRCLAAQIENRPGEAVRWVRSGVSRSAPDGQTLLLALSPVLPCRRVPEKEAWGGCEGRRPLARLTAGPRTQDLKPERSRDMRIVNYRADGAARLGVIKDDAVVDPQRVAGHDPHGWFADTISLIRGGDDALTALKQIVAKADTRAAVRLADVQLAAPIMPSTILCSGSNYHDHNAEKLNTGISGKEPEFFIKTSDCVIGPDADIIYDPVLSQKIDCETELAVVIEKAGAPYSGRARAGPCVRLHHRQRRDRA